MKILIIAPSWIGDTVLAQPLFRRLHALHANLALDVLAPSWSLPLLARMPEVNAALLNPFAHGELKLVQRWRVARSLAKNHYDQAIVLPNSLKSALLPFFAGIAKRTGYVGEMRYGLLNDARALNKKNLPLMVERFAQLAEPADVDVYRPVAQPSLRIDPMQRQQTLDKQKLDITKPIAVFCPGAEYGPAKRWPAEYFSQLAQQLASDGYQVWLIGSQNDADIGDVICKGNVHCVNLCGKTTLDEAIDLLSYAKIVVSNDSGLMHIAAALEKPMLALYGSSSPKFTPPLSDAATVMQLNLPCSPCFQRTCPLGHFNCMMQLSPEQVANKLKDITMRSS